MPFNGSGTFNRVHRWVDDAGAGIDILPDRFDAEDDGYADGLTNTICRDGQSTILNDIPWSGKKITSLGNPTDPGDAVNLATADGRYGRFAIPDSYGATGYASQALAASGTDQSSALQAWLNAGVSLSAMCALLPGKWYRCDAQLTLAANQEVVGHPSSGIVGPALPQGSAMFRATGTEGSPVSLLANALTGTFTAKLSSSSIAASFSAFDLLYFRSGAFWCPIGGAGQAVTDGEFAEITNVDTAATYLSAIGIVTTTLTSGASIGDTVLHVTATTGITDGQAIFVATNDDATKFDQTTVVSHTSNTITLAAALTHAYTTGDCTVEWPPKTLTVAYVPAPFTNGATIRIFDQGTGVNETATIASVSGNVITLTAPPSNIYGPRYMVLTAANGWVALSRPLHRDYKTSDSANVCKQTLMQGIRLRGLQLVGPSATTLTNPNFGTEAIWLEHAQDAIIEDCVLSGFSNSAVVISHGYRIRGRGGVHGDIQGVGFAYGWNIANGSEDVQISGTSSRRIRNAIAMGGIDGVNRRIRFSNMCLAAQGGLDNHPAVDDVTYFQCTLDGYQAGGSFDTFYMHAGNIKIIGCTIYAPNRHGISWEPLGDGVRQCSLTVADCDIFSYDAVYEGIVVLNDTAGQVITVTATNNRINGFNRGIHVECTAGKVRQVVIQGNTIGDQIPPSGSPGASILLETELTGVIESGLINGNAVATVPGSIGISLFASTAGAIKKIELDCNTIRGGDATSYSINVTNCDRVRSSRTRFDDDGGVLPPTYITSTNSYDCDSLGATSTPCFLAHLSANQTLTSGVNATIAFDAIDDDPNGWWDAPSSSWIPKQPGRYSMECVSLLTGTWVAGSAQMQIALVKSGVTAQLAQNSAQVSAAAKFSLVARTYVSANGTTDALSVVAKATATSPAVQGSSNKETVISICRIGS